MKRKRRFPPLRIAAIRNFPAALLLLCGLLASCTRSAEPSLELRVMTFNIEWGGEHVSFDKVIEAIRRANADIVGIQEAEGNLRLLADRLGWHYDLRNYVISKHPLIDPPGGDGKFVFAEVSDGRFVAIANVHLPSDPYGPDAVRDGAAIEDVIAIENRVRLPKMRPVLDALKPLTARDIPLFMTGDFNAPAHGDWTEAAVGTRPFIRFAVDWPVSLAVAAAGFRDSWREVHPDALADPGLTWWAGRPPLELYAPGESDPEDRIDFIHFSGPVSVTGSELVGEPEAKGVSISVSPWPSDHRALVSGFAVRPAELPRMLTTVHRVYRTGDSIAILYRRAANDTIRVSRIADDGAETTVLERPASGNGSIQVAGGLLGEGHFRVDMTNMGGESTPSRDFWVLNPTAEPEIEVTATTFSSGKAISVRWRDAPGNRNDYVGIVRVSSDSVADSVTDTSLPWAYVNAMPQGQLLIDETTSEWGWPIDPGIYAAHLFLDDGYKSLARSEAFVVD
ncbi:MAG: endonuclease/exonuclease/phosphatase family protein [Gammaproteobacteria bacterium]|nr:endonuclease/exonuclease/phosphatase family protein [Gammaproteobacteria bacterium]MDH4314999.1 endonuclease/exonuclease/phosphatase family protein [Gammaproteobacteria bacterium]MDH5215337.1 endonuclease/exonuclease/phosphatase family protein [Gammaproteobacteria bacterium]